MTAFDGSVLGLGSRMLHRLRHVLERDLGEQTGQLLQEAGFAAGDELYDAFTGWLADRTGVQDPADLDSRHLGRMMGEFFRALGWGQLAVERLGAGSLALDSADWAEADPNADTFAPSCHVTAGLLAGFLGRLADQDVAVLEIECRSRHDERCRFLAGSPQTLQAVYEAVTAGQDYREVLAAG
ncbi:MAG TPA: V4R domain-containing protein [Gemmatimonadales bacterium]|nr:V4R domain-containing protein [Gemmatimonadales bacterium]